MPVALREDLLTPIAGDNPAGKSLRYDPVYDKIKEDVEFRKEWAEKCEFGFKLPSVVPNVPKMEENSLTAIVA